MCHARHSVSLPWTLGLPTSLGRERRLEYAERRFRRLLARCACERKGAGAKQLRVWLVSSSRSNDRAVTKNKRRGRQIPPSMIVVGRTPKKH
jgi:hypothetical protein